MTHNDWIKIFITEKVMLFSDVFKILKIYVIFFYFWVQAASIFSNISNNLNYQIILCVYKKKI